MCGASWAGILITTGHVQSCRNLGGPSSKAKYSLTTDSEQVPRGKGEKNPDEGSEKNLKSYAYNQWEGYAFCRKIGGMPNRVPFA